MRTVYKYKLNVHPPYPPITKIALPLRATPIHAARFNGELVVWIELDTSDPVESEATFVIVGTGRALPAGDYEYATTVIDGEYVWHIFYLSPLKHRIAAMVDGLRPKGKV